MAAKTSFKQQCPSCEAMVPIKDSSLVGKKIDCPKCKYRFVVEEPVVDAEEEAVGAEEDTPAPTKKIVAGKGAITAAKGANGKPAIKPGAKADPAAKGAKGAGAKSGAKKKSGDGGNSNTMIYAAGGFAALLIGFGIWFFFLRGGGEKQPVKKDKPKPVDVADDPKDKPGDGGPVGEQSTVDITNLLPNDTQGVALLNLSPKAGEVTPFFPSSFASALFDTQGAFSLDAFKNKFGFELKSVDQIVVASNHKQNWNFAIFRVGISLDEKKDDLTKRLGLQLGPQSKDLGFDYFMIGEPLDDFTLGLFKKGNNKPGPMALHVFDNNTLVLGDVKAVVQFLASTNEGTKRQPAILTKVDAQAPMGGAGGAFGMGGAAGGPPANFGMAGAAGGPPANFGMAGAAGGPPANFGMMGAGGAAGGPPANFGMMGAGGAAGGPPANFGMMGAGGAAGGPPANFGMMGAAGGPPANFGMMGAAGGPPANFGMMGAAGGPPANFGNFGQMGGAPRPVITGSFVTIKPSLKRLLDEMEFKKRVVTVAGEGDLDSIISVLSDAGVAQDTNLNPKDLKQYISNDLETGYFLRTFSSDRLTAGLTVEMNSTKEATDAATILRRVVAEKLAAGPLKGKISVVGGASQGNFGMQGAAGAFGQMGGPPGNFGNFGQAGGPPANFGMAGAAGGPPANFGMAGAAGGPPANFGMAGAAGGPPANFGMAGAAGQAGGRPANFGMAGAAGGPPANFGMAGAAGGPPANFGMAGAAGGPPANFGMMGGPPANFGQMGGPPANFGNFGQMGGPPANFGNFGQMGGPMGGQPASASTISITSNGKMLLAMVELQLSENKGWFSAIREGVGQSALMMKNQSLMMHHRSYRGDLGRALAAYVNDKKAFPQGTLVRPAPRQGLPWQPEQRLAWTADLMRYLGPSLKDMQPDLSKSWNEGPNLSLAAMAVPQLLAPDDPPGSYPSSGWAQPVSGTPIPVVATHFVGIAGLGEDAAYDDPADPAVKNKLGVFGYDRVTKVTDITDGLDKTIALIQVPANYKTCWLAGGGSTVRGVAETDPLSAFVCTEYKGKKGTFAIMCDGKVRFIAADMNPDTFKALCTISGGELIDNIDAIAPEVKEDVVVLKPGPLPVPVDPVKPPPAGDDVAALKGTWKLVKGVKDGQPAGEEEKKTEMVFDGAQVTIKDGGLKLAATMVLNSTKNPKWIDLTLEGRNLPGIYELSADTLKLCVSMRDERPTDFTAETGSKRSFTELKRASGEQTVQDPKPGVETPKGWEKFAPDGEKFSISLMPGVRNRTATKKLFTFEFASETGGGTLLIWIHEGDPKRNVENRIGNFGFGMSDVYKKHDVKQRKFQGRECTEITLEKEKETSRFLLISDGDRMYEVARMVNSKSSEAFQKDANRMLDSFQFNSPVKAPK